MEKIAKKYIPLVMASLALTIIVFWGQLSNSLSTDIALPSKVANNLSTIQVPAPGSVETNVADWVETMDNILNSAYITAVKDAKEPKASAISNNLWPISKENKNLHWNDQDQDQVLVVTWTSSRRYKDEIGKKITLNDPENPKKSRDPYVWVTPVPQVKDFCRALKLDKTLRLEEYMGLPPHNGKAEFVEMWVNPKDLIRPCKDPEITDNTCGLEFPANVNEEYKNWFKEQVSLSYPQDKPGYPWTQLGYTYDWGTIGMALNFQPKEVTDKGGKDVVVKKAGASEYVMLRNSTVTLASINNTRDYCNPKK